MVTVISFLYCLFLGVCCFHSPYTINYFKSSSLITSAINRDNIQFEEHNGENDKLLHSQVENMINESVSSQNSYIKIKVDR